jgi:hypothetical protein
MFLSPWSVSPLFRQQRWNNDSTLLRIVCVCHLLFCCYKECVHQENEIISRVFVVGCGDDGGY